MSSPVVRLSVNLPVPSKENLDYLIAQTDHSQTEIVRDALELYASLAKLAVAEVSLYVKDAGGNEIPYAIPGMAERYTQSLITAATDPTPPTPQP